MDYEVSSADQGKIVEFSLLFNKRQKIQNELASLKSEMNLIKDAQEEVLINLDVPLLQIGECFMELNQEDLESELETRSLNLKSKIDQLESELEENLNKSSLLKGDLYNKFGNRINLD